MGNNIPILWTGEPDGNVPYAAFRIEMNFQQPFGVIQVDINGAAFWPTSGKAVNDGIWHFVLVTYDGTTVKIYVDGKFDNSATSWNAASSFSLSSTVNTQTNYIVVNQRASLLKNVNFYDYALSDPSLVGLCPLGFTYYNSDCSAPSSSPTAAPTSSSTSAPSLRPTAAPSSGPTAASSSSPTGAPSSGPTAAPSSGPTAAPTSGSTGAPSSSSTAAPSPSPTAAPSSGPTSAPSSGRTLAPTLSPSTAPFLSLSVSPSSGWGSNVSE